MQIGQVQTLRRGRNCTQPEPDQHTINPTLIEAALDESSFKINPLPFLLSNENLNSLK